MGAAELGLAPRVYSRLRMERCKGALGWGGGVEGDF